MITESNGKEHQQIPYGSFGSYFTLVAGSNINTHVAWSE